MPQRKIVQIDESKCDGCGQCVPSCAEGAIQIVNGKARLVTDVYCDGLGACLGHCPQGAIRLIEREAAPFDETAAHQHVEAMREVSHEKQGGCPGSSVQSFPLNILPPDGTRSGVIASADSVTRAKNPSELLHWPIQLHLVPPGAPFLHEADLLLVADCVPFALADFHERFLRGRSVVIGCPKLDDTRFYVEKLAAIFQQAAVRRLTIVHMEVPCCMGLLRIAQAAIASSGVNVPLDEVTISVRGRILNQK